MSSERPNYDIVSEYRRDWELSERTWNTSLIAGALAGGALLYGLGSVAAHYGNASNYSLANKDKACLQNTGATSNPDLINFNGNLNTSSPQLLENCQVNTTAKTLSEDQSVVSFGLATKTSKDFTVYLNSIRSDMNSKIADANNTVKEDIFNVTFVGVGAVLGLFFTGLGLDAIQRKKRKYSRFI